MQRAEAMREHFLVRVSGLPIDGVERLRGMRTMASYRLLCQMNQRIDLIREPLEHALFGAIGSTIARLERNQLLRLRRDLHNRRSPRQADVAIARETLPGEAIAQLDSYCDLMDSRASVTRSIADSYQRDLVDSRGWLQSAVADEDFRRGLLMSSQTLFMNLRRYVATPAERFGSREEQIERGLVRYFTRASMKATPFGTFCGILPGVIVNQNDGSLRASYIGDPRVKRSVVRINKRLFARLWSHLKQRPAVRAALVIELTPTLAAEERELLFLTSTGGVEVFQRLERNEALDKIVSLLQDRGGVRFRAAVDHLCGDVAVEATAEEVRAYLDHLLQLGLLRFRSGIVERDADWDVPFAEMLSVVEDEHAKLAANLLRSLRRSIQEYGSGDAGVRERIAQEVRERVTSSFDTLGVADRNISELPFYEDASAGAQLRLVLDDDIGAALARVHELVAMMLPANPMRVAQATMRHFFDVHYGGECQSVPLLQFYEDYYREHFKAHLERQIRSRALVGRNELGDYDLGNPFKLDFITKQNSIGQSVTQLMRRRWANEPNAEEIVLSQQELQAIYRRADALSPRSRSASVFCQIDLATPNRHRTRIVMPAATTHTGWGKYFSRFLYVLPSTMLDAVYEDNNANRDVVLAEICADGEFNANLHPRLTRWEISYPTSENVGVSDQLLTSELDVRRDPHAAHQLRLVHRSSDSTVIPLDLGFLNSRMRPPLFQLLSSFNDSGYNALQIPHERTEHQQTTAAETIGGEEAISGAGSGLRKHTNDIANHPGGIVYRPRFTYERSVVLSRRRWSIDGSHFPRRDANEGDADYFVRVNQWRESNGIPEQVYMKIRPIAEERPIRPAMEVVEEELARVGAVDSQSDLVDSAIETEPGSDRRRDAATSRECPESDTSGQNDKRASAPTEQKSRPRTKNSRDWLKPQYVDFASPILVKLFAQIPAALERFVAILEERLPDSDGIPTAGTDRFAAELVIQFNLSSMAENQAALESQLL